MPKFPDLIYHGVGKSQLVFSDGSIFNIDEAENLQIATSATEGSQRGGDGLYALLTWVQEKTAKLTINNAVFSLEGIKATTGSEVTSGSEVFVFSDKQTPAAGKCTLSKDTGVIVDSVVCCKVSDGTPLLRIATGIPTANQFTVSVLGAVVLESSVTEELEFSYSYTDATGQGVHMLENDVPGQCELRHYLITDEMSDGKRYRIDVRAYRCKGTGAFEYSADKSKGFSPKLEFNVLDAKRDDKRVCSYNITEYKA